MLGYEPSEYIGRSVADFHVDEDVIASVMQRLTQGEPIQDQRARLRARDGSIRHVLIRSTPLIENGTFKHTRCFTLDVTARVAAEAELRESEERFRTLADNISILAWTADRTGAVRWYNKRWLEYTGTSLEDMKAWGMDGFLHPEHRERVLTTLS